MLNLVFANNKDILLIFLVEFTESVLDIFLFPESTRGPLWSGPEKNFQNTGSQKAGKCYSEIGCLQIQCFIREPYC